MTIIEILLLVVIIGLILKEQGNIHNHLAIFIKRPRLILDSCALIDGRILEVVKAGFLNDTMIIPQFILSELQLLADGQDSHKRKRARYGLDVATELQADKTLKVVIDSSAFPSVTTNDDKLMALAKKLHANLYTTDHNLEKVAELMAVKVVNINKLALDLRPAYLPGEKVTVEITQKGSNQDQGVGYLEDGTMIVVDNAAKSLGKRVLVTVDKIHQTVAGKMVFGHIKNQAAPTHKIPTVAPRAALVKSRLRKPHTRRNGTRQQI
jgi:uncharacterized protein YacL